MKYYWNENSIPDASYIPFRGPAMIFDATGLAISRVLACDTETGYVMRIASDDVTGKPVIIGGELFPEHRTFPAPLRVEKIPLYNYGVKYPKADRLTKSQKKAINRRRGDGK